MQLPRMFILLSFARVLMGMTVPTRAADSFSFTTLDPHGATIASANGINDAGQVVGFFRRAGAKDHAFLRTATGTFTTFDDPDQGALRGSPLGINDAGQIVGVFMAGDREHGFVMTR